MSAQGPDRKAAVSRDDWETPGALFAAIDAEFHFTMDLAASRENTKVRDLYAVGPCGGIVGCGCGLCYSFEYMDPRTIWCNPPYGVGLIAWIRRFYRLARSGNTVVALLPATSPETAWGQEVLATAEEIRYLTPRVQFVGTGKSGNTGGSMLAIWRPSVPGLSAHGLTVRTWRWREAVKAEVFGEVVDA